MNYYVLKTINNNVVLAKNIKTDEKVILMAKGIGFHRKVNDKVSDIDGENQIFKLWTNNEPIKDYKYNKNELEAVVSEIAQIAHKNLGLNKEDLFNPLLDHIIFLVDRLNFGIYTENPFQNEISILYAKEYEIAKYAADLIKERTGIDVGESEIGFITLHLNSAIRKKPVSASLDKVRVYNEISNLISIKFGNKVSSDFIDIRIFLITLDRLVKIIKSGIHLDIDFSDVISSSISFSYNIAVEIGKILKDEIKIEPNESDIAFLAIDVERLRQLNNIREEG